MTVTVAGTSGSTASGLCTSASPTGFSAPSANSTCGKGNFPSAKICLLNCKANLFCFCKTRIILSLTMDTVSIYLILFVSKINLQPILVFNSSLLFITKTLLFINEFKVLYRQV